MASADVMSMPSQMTGPTTGQSKSNSSTSQRPSSGRSTSSTSKSRSKQPTKTITSEQAMSKLHSNTTLGWDAGFESQLQGLAEKVTVSNPDTVTYVQSTLNKLWQSTFSNAQKPQSLRHIGTFDNSKVNEDIRSDVTGLYHKFKPHLKWAKYTDGISGNTFSKRARHEIDKHLWSTVKGKSHTKGRSGTKTGTPTETGAETLSNPRDKRSAHFSDGLTGGRESKELRTTLRSSGATDDKGNITDQKKFEAIMAKYASTNKSAKTTLPTRTERKDAKRSEKSTKRDKRAKRLGADIVKKDTATSGGMESRKERKKREWKEKKQGTATNASTAARDTVAPTSTDAGKSKATLENLRTTQGASVPDSTKASSATGRPKNREEMMKKLAAMKEEAGVGPSPSTQVSNSDIKTRIAEMQAAKQKGGGGNYEMVDSTKASSKDTVYSPGRMAPDSSGKTVRKQLEDTLKKVLESKQWQSYGPGKYEKRIALQGDGGMTGTQVQRIDGNTQETYTEIHEPSKTSLFDNLPTGVAAPTNMRSGPGISKSTQGKGMFGGLTDKVSSMWGGRNRSSVY